MQLNVLLFHYVLLVAPRIKHENDGGTHWAQIKTQTRNRYREMWELIKSVADYPMQKL